MTTLEIAVGFTLLLIALALAGRRVSTPLPVLLALAGLAIGLLWHVVPELPRIEVPSRVMLALVLPPLLAHASYMVPLGAFRANARPISLLAVGLVVVTMVTVAFATDRGARLALARCEQRGDLSREHASELRDWLRQGLSGMTPAPDASLRHAARMALDARRAVVERLRDKSELDTDTAERVLMQLDVDQAWLVERD